MPLSSSKVFETPMIIAGEKIRQQYTLMWEVKFAECRKVISEVVSLRDP